VSELERMLERVDFPFPPTPDLAGAVRGRLPVRRRLTWRRAAVLALATAAVALGALLAASPDARSTFLDWFGIGGVEVRLVDELPPLERRAQPEWGERVTLEEARTRAAFDVLVPEALGRPDAVYFRASPPGGMVTLRYGTAAAPRAVLSQWSGRVIEPVVVKLVPRDSRSHFTDVDGVTGVWLSGAPHVFFFFGTDGREYGETLAWAGNVLVWERGSRSYRLQADVPRERAVEIARSLR
jgi:hypothetical protein